MPITPEETLQKILDATQEARVTVQELHEQRAALLDVLKSQRQRIDRDIQDEVERTVEVLRQEATRAMKAGVEWVINELRDDWRQKLGLSE